MAKQTKGKRPVYFDDPQVDQLLSIVLELMGEVSVLRERLDTLERLAEAAGILSRTEIEAYQPSEAVAAERSQWRKAYLQRVLRVLQAEVDAIASGSSPE